MSTAALILDNLAQAALRLVERFEDPAKIPEELKRLLADLGFANPQDFLSNKLAQAAASMGQMTDALKQLDIGTNAESLAQLQARARLIRDAIDSILRQPAEALAGLDASFDALKAQFPRRLLDFIVYEFLMASHPKIAGVLCLLGILRRERIPTEGSPSLLENARVRIFDLTRFIEALTQPRKTFVTVLGWGEDRFEARALVDGLARLLGTIPGTAVGPEDAVFTLAQEARFFDLTPGLATDSAMRELTVPGPLGSKVAFVGLHKQGLGLYVPNPASFDVGANGMNLPTLPNAYIVQVDPGASPATDTPTPRLREPRAMPP